MLEKFKSRKFLLALGSALLVLLNEGLGFGIPEEAFNRLVALVVAYLLAEGAVDVAKAFKRP